MTGKKKIKIKKYKKYKKYKNSTFKTNFAQKFSFNPIILANLRKLFIL